MEVTADNSDQLAYDVHQGCTNSGGQFVVYTKFCTVVPNL
jgi:hypothetical protein